MVVSGFWRWIGLVVFEHFDQIIGNGGAEPRFFDNGLGSQSIVVILVG